MQTTFSAVSSMDMTYFHSRMPVATETTSKEKSIDKAAKDFEAMFLSEMLSHMFKDNIENQDPLFGGGKGEKMFQGLLINEYAKRIANNPHGIGLSDSIKKAMIEIQQKTGGKNDKV